MESTSTAARTVKTGFAFFDLQAQFASIRLEILQAIESVLESQHFIMGQQVELFENEAAAYVGSPHAVGCASGTDALYLALCAQGVGPGDEVILRRHSLLSQRRDPSHVPERSLFSSILTLTRSISLRTSSNRPSQNKRARSFPCIYSGWRRNFAPF